MQNSQSPRGKQVRKEVEQCDRLGGLMLLQSLAGGTGCGSTFQISM